MDDIEEENKTHTYVIPKVPVAQDSTTEPGRTTPVGLALNGVNFDPPAPTDAILSAYTLAPFDDCGGHVNLNGGYHYHAHTGCSTEVEQADDHAPLIGYAMDGYPLYAQLDKNGAEPGELDQCRGQYDEVRGYHYHVADSGTNSFIGCFQGETGCKLDGDGEGQTCDASAIDEGGRPPNGGPPNGGPPGGGPPG